MRSEDRYDSLVQYFAERHNLDWRLIKRQIGAESSFDPRALSPAGAKGLMQFVDAAWQDYGGAGDPFNPEDNIAAGCKYMAWLFSRFGEIPDPTERYRCALAAYNAGRGNINEMLGWARDAAGVPKGYTDWVAAGRPPGIWQRWEFASRFLSLVTGDHARETLVYVARIMPEDAAAFT